MLAPTLPSIPPLYRVTFSRRHSAHFIPHVSDSPLTKGLWRALSPLFFFSFFTILGFTQEVKVYESKLINTERLNIEYMDFGGEGIPLIVVQGAHNYFDTNSTNPYINYENNSWVSLFAEFTKNYHVVAPLKRGFGKTDTQLNEESVKASTQDLISFIDKMGFEKAFFIQKTKIL